MKEIYYLETKKLLFKKAPNTFEPAISRTA